MAPLLILRNIGLTFGGHPLLSGADLSVSEGERLCLVGRNGSGKSTLLKIAAGLVQPDSGDRDSEGPAQRQVLECRRVRASAEVARALALRPGDPVVQARRVLAFGGVPTILEDLWLPGAAFKGLSAEQMAGYQGPTYAMFEVEFGVRMVRAEEKIRAIAADAQQAQLLQVPPGTPLLSVERVAYTYNDIPMELRRGVYRTDTHHYRNALS